MFRSIRTGLLALFVALSIIPLLFVGGLLTGQIYSLEQRHILELQHAVSARAATELTAFIEDADQELRAIIQTADLQGASHEHQDDVLSQAVFFKNTFDELTLLDRTGREVARVSRLGVAPLANLRSRAENGEFQEPMRTNKTYYGSIRFSPLHGEPLLSMAVPILSATTGEPDGVLIGEVRLRQVLDRVTNTQFGINGAITVVSQDGAIIAHRDPAVQSQHGHFDVTLSEGIGNGVTGTEAVLTNENLALGNLMVHLVAELPIDEARAPVIETLGTTLLLLFVTIIVATVSGVFAVNRIVHPLLTLARTAQSIRAGNLSEQLAVTEQNEIGMLQRDLNQMVHHLREQQGAIAQHNEELQASFAALQEREQELRIFKALADNAPDHIAVATLNGYITYMNPTCRSQYRPHQGNGRICISDIVATQELERLQSEILPRIQSRGSWVGRAMHRRSDESTFPAQGAGFAVEDETGSVQAIAWITRDITEQLRAEEERATLQEQIIQAQQAAIRELSTPLIPIADRVVIMPLIGTIDTQRAQQILETLLAGVSGYRAKTVILDTTGVKAVDTHTADTFIQAAQAVRLLGAQVVLTGIHPQTAQMMVQMGLELRGITTHSTLQSGIAAVLARR